MVGQVREECGEVRLDVDARLSRVLDAREEVRQARAGVGVPDEEPVLRAQLHGADRVLDRVVVEPRVGRGDAPGEWGTLREQVADGLPERALRRQHEPVGGGAGEEGVGEGRTEARAPGRHACGVVRMCGGDAPRAGVEAEQAVELRHVRPGPGLPEPRKRSTRTG